jgi:uncharacterized membrane protein YcaP (DUF421 family)
MEVVIRAVIIYFVLFFLFRISGKRTINDSQPFGLVLSLLISSSVADALKDEDRSMTGGIIIACTLVSIHFIMSFVKSGNHDVTRVIDDVPTVLVKDGKYIENELKRARVNREDILSAARQQKITKIDEVRYAILEIDGSISIISKE